MLGRYTEFRPNKSTFAHGLGPSRTGKGAPNEHDKHRPSAAGHPVDHLEHRAALSSTLIAGLELARGGQLRLRQEEAFGPILVGRGRDVTEDETMGDGPVEDEA